MTIIKDDDWMSRKELEAAGFDYLGKDVKVSRHALIYGPEKKRLWDHSIIRAGAQIHHGKFELGFYSAIGAGAIIICAGVEVFIHNFCGVGPGAILLSATDDFKGAALVGPAHQEPFRRVIKRYIFLDQFSIVGAGAILLPGTCLREGAVVGAGRKVSGIQKPWLIDGKTPRPKEAIIALADARVKLDSET